MDDERDLQQHQNEVCPGLLVIGSVEAKPEVHSHKRTQDVADAGQKPQHERHGNDDFGHIHLGSKDIKIRLDDLPHESALAAKSGMLNHSYVAARTLLRIPRQIHQRDPNTAH